MNVSGILVKCLPQYVDELAVSLDSSGLCEVYLKDESGKIIVVIEGEDIGEEMGKLKKVMLIPHVISADMVYSYNEDELSQAKESFEIINKRVPEILKKECVDASEIVYGGDLKRKM
ncbi:MAG: chaperone NapD [Campylobacterales bacterium]|nr:chaperone NapD [Campylobacterales bacterium]